MKTDTPVPNLICNLHAVRLVQCVLLAPNLYLGFNDPEPMKADFGGAHLSVFRLRFDGGGGFRGHLSRWFSKRDPEMPTRWKVEVWGDDPNASKKFRRLFRTFDQARSALIREAVARLGNEPAEPATAPVAAPAVEPADWSDALDAADSFLTDWQENEGANDQACTDRVANLAACRVQLPQLEAAQRQRDSLARALATVLDATAPLVNEGRIGYGADFAHARALLAEIKTTALRPTVRQARLEEAYRAIADATAAEIDDLRLCCDGRLDSIADEKHAAQVADGEPS